MISFYCCSYVWINSFTVGKFWQHCHISAHISLVVVCLSNNYFRNFYHQSTFPFIIIIIIIIPLFFIIFNTVSGKFICFIFKMFRNAQLTWCLLYHIYTLLYIITYYIYFIIKKKLLTLLGFVSDFIRSASYSNMRLSLIFAGLIFANMRLANLVPTSRWSLTMLKKKDDSSGYAYGFCEMKLFILALTSHNHRWR